MDLTTLIHQACGYHGWPMVHDGAGGFRIEVPANRGRKQVVQVAQVKDPDGKPTACFFSVVCDLSAVHDPYFLLRKNCELVHGALAVRGQEVIVLQFQLIETADPEEIVRSIYYVAKYADDLEIQAFGGTVDRN